MSNISDLKELSSSVDFWGTTTGFNSDRLCEILAFAVNSVEQLKAAERERDEMRADVELGMQLIKRMERQVLDYQIEIARRDAAAGEPVGYVDQRAIDSEDGNGGMWVKRQSRQENSYSAPIFTAALPAVLPPEMFCEKDGEDLLGQAYLAGYNQCRADALALGAQQQKVVELYKRKSMEVISGQRYSYVLLEDLLPELDAANVKWEVKK